MVTEACGLKKLITQYSDHASVSPRLLASSIYSEPQKPSGISRNSTPHDRESVLVDQLCVFDGEVVGVVHSVS
jgi:hypothetical protein